MKKTKIKKTKVDEASELAVLQKLTKELFSLMGLKSEAEVTEDTKNSSFLVNITGDTESGLLIGARGRTLLSLQNVLGLMCRQQFGGEWKRVVVNVADYREKEEERLKQLAVQTADRAKSTGEPQHLYNLTPSQRRLVHMALSEDSGISTESQGEGSDRYLVVSSKG